MKSVLATFDGLAKAVRQTQSTLRVEWNVNKSLALLLSFVALSGCASTVPPKAFPELDASSVVDVVAVVTSRHGGSLPQFAECDGPDVICMDPPPFWFHVRVRDVVFGPWSPGQRAAVASTSHYGMAGTISEDEPRLVRLRSDGHAVTMPRYAQANLERRKDGEWLLVLWHSGPIWWLPCEITELAEPIRQSEMRNDLIADPELFGPEQLEAERDFLELTPAGVVPRFAITISALSNALQARYANAPLPYCEQVP